MEFLKPKVGRTLAGALLIKHVQNWELHRKILPQAPFQLLPMSSLDRS
jgi:hypothetical protein